MELLVVIGIVLVLAAVVVVGFVTRRPTKALPPVTPEPQLAEPRPELQPEPPRTVADVDSPLLGETALDVPDPTAGRLTRLRGRLSRSQTTLGRGLFALLSRDTLDDETWEEVEDTLLTSDMGVAATTELVGRLKQRVRVEGLTNHEELRAILRE